MMETEEYYRFEPQKYDQLVNLILNNEGMKDAYTKIKSRHPTALDLVSTDWEEKLQSTEVYKNWEKGFKGKEIKNPKVDVCKVFQIPANCRLAVLMIGDFMFFRKSKLKESTNLMDARNKCEIFNAGPIHKLADVFSEKQGMKKFGYIRVHIENCNGCCNQCKKYGIKASENVFCSKYLSFFDGTHQNLITSEYIRSGNAKNYIGIGLAEITNYITFGENFMSFKFGGNLIDSVITNEPSIRPLTDEGDTMKLLRIANYAELEEEEEEEKKTSYRQQQQYNRGQQQQPYNPGGPQQQPPQYLLPQTYPSFTLPSNFVTQPQQQIQVRKRKIIVEEDKEEPKMLRE